MANLKITNSCKKNQPNHKYEDDKQIKIELMIAKNVARAKATKRKKTLHGEWSQIGHMAAKTIIKDR